VSAERLKVSVGSPLLKLSRIFFSAEEEAVDYVEILYRPDQFEYRTTLSRGTDNRFEIDRVEQDANAT
jgi:GntR family transcriptional regulator